MTQTISYLVAPAQQPEMRWMFDNFNMMPCRGLADLNPKAPRYSINAGKKYKYTQKIELASMITGRANAGLEALDFDNHFGDALDYLNTVLDHYDFSAFPISQSPKGGYHIYFRSGSCGNNTVLAMDANTVHPKGKATIETRGQGGLIVAPPSVGYVLINGTFESIPVISDEDREWIFDLCRTLNKYVRPVKEYNQLPIRHSGNRIGDIFNASPQAFSIMCSALSAMGWKIAKSDKTEWTRPGKGGGVSATLGRVNHSKTGLPLFHNFSPNSGLDLGSATYFTAYTNIMHAGDYTAAVKDIAQMLGIDNKTEAAAGRLQERVDKAVDEADFYGDKKKTEPATELKTPATAVPAAPNSQTADEHLAAYNSYFRVGTKFYRKITMLDGLSELKVWDRQTLIDMYGKEAPKSIRSFAEFVNVPSHTDYQEVIGNYYNLYNPPSLTPVQGGWATIEILLRHLFSEQYSMILDWLSIAYLDPMQRLPVIFLVSRRNQVGKGTFSKLLNRIFGDNYTQLTSKAYSSEFNSSYVTKNIVDIDEGELTASDVQKMKYESTTPRVLLRRMHTDHVKANFFAKFIVQSNKVTHVAKITAQDDRFWVREICKSHTFDPCFDDNVQNEAAAFLHFLITRELCYKEKRGRMWFAPVDYVTDALKNIIKASRHDGLTSLYYILEDMIQAAESSFINISIRDCQELIQRQHGCSPGMIREAFVEELKAKHLYGRYRRFGSASTYEGGNEKRGTYYQIRLDELTAALGGRGEDNSTMPDVATDTPFESRGGIGDPPF
jgi:hypothetical protein